MRILASLSNEMNMQETYRKGKDLYSTMAAEAFHTTYEECLEFYLDENGNKTDKTYPEGKRRRTQIKGVLLGIMYGRGTASVAESIHSTPEEAQKIIDDFFDAYPGIKVFVEKEQEKAKLNGFTTTAWGRRRYLKHIQSEPYDFRYNENRKIDFNPLFTSTNKIEQVVPQEIRDEYISKLEKLNSYRRAKLIEQARLDGITIRDNNKDIAESNRQVVNSIIQGRLHCPYTLNPITQGCVV